jgi:hypothetical protein
VLKASSYLGISVAILQKPLHDEELVDALRPIAAQKAMR